MKVAIRKERRPNESRVAASPETVRKFVALGLDVVVESGAGAGASIPDDAFSAAGATIADDEAAALSDADIVLVVQRPLGADEGGPDELSPMKRGAILIGALDVLANRPQVDAYARAGITAFALELLPRITRAQSMDILSSQSNVAGYRAVIEAVNAFGRVMPMMMTAAGTIPPARVLILGAGVAGLQAIATARRLGAMVSAYDVRPAVKEQVESLGAKFVEVDPEAVREAETAAGYAREMSADYQARQAEVVHRTLMKQDIAICTALIPGRPAPRLITAEMVKDMMPGSVIVDLAVEQGGNCELSEFGQVVTRHGVTIIGYANVASRIAEHATAMYAKNLLNFVTPLIDAESGALGIDWEDEIIQGCLITRDGRIVHPAFQDEEAKLEAG